MSLLQIGIPALAGLSVLHGLVPPHPGPLIAVSSLGADLGLTLAFGLLCAIPTVIIAGPVFGNFIAKRVHVPRARRWSAPAPTRRATRTARPGSGPAGGRRVRRPRRPGQRGQPGSPTSWSTTTCRPAGATRASGPRC